MAELPFGLVAALGHNGDVDPLAVQVLAKLAALAPGAKALVVAVSGGPDSVALLRLLHGGPYTLYVGHVDHGLRAESADDARFVARLGADLGLAVHLRRAEVRRAAAARGWNLEDAARRLRYSALARLARELGADAVVTAHTRDDQAETVLMQLLRGSAFVKGMAPRRGRVVRPLLELSRATLLEVLNELGQPWLEDASNRDLRLTRVWLRLEILPRLEARYPAVKGTLARLAEAQRAQDAHFAALVAPLLEGDALDTAALKARDPATQRSALAALLKRAGVAPDWATLERLRGELAATRPRRLTLVKGLEARLAYGKLRLGKTVNPPETRPAQAFPPELDGAALTDFPDLVYRGRQPGDRIRLAGGSKKLSDLLIDRKVPREARDSLRVLASGSQVLWVEGLAADVRVAKPQADPQSGPQGDADVSWMRRALEEAEGALARGEVPVGAVVVKDGVLLAASGNESEARRDPTAHAELLALREAAQALGDWRLLGCALYVTLEPCAMCYGAMLQAQLPRLVYGAANVREGAAGTVVDLGEAPLKHHLERRGGVLAWEAAALLQRFFQARR